MVALPKVFERGWSRKGFTLVELLVSVSIIGILSTMVAVNYPDTNTRLNVSNVTSNIALQFREAQLRGSSVDTLGGSAAGYGLYFAKSSPLSFIYFFDKVTTEVNEYGLLKGDSVYNGSDEIKSTISMPQNFRIYRFCVGSSVPTMTCSSTSASLTSLTVLFTRPNPQPLIYYNGDPLLSEGVACVEVSTLTPTVPGHTRSVTVYASGIIVHSPRACK